jgi:PHD/YefM family antitoxin component YafN of YafNO toxin-antitoxin module
MDLDMELDPTDVTKINPEAAAVIGLDEKKEDMDEEMRKDDMDEEMKDEVKENLNESVEAFPLWNRIK